MNHTGRIYFDPDGQPITRKQWAKIFEHGKRIVARTTVGPVEISTVWLGIDHSFREEDPPLIYETMAFWLGTPTPGHGLEDWCERYTTREQAEAGHTKMCRDIAERFTIPR